MLRAFLKDSQCRFKETIAKGSFPNRATGLYWQRVRVKRHSPACGTEEITAQLRPRIVLMDLPRYG